MRKWIVLGVVLMAIVAALLVAAANLDRWLDENRDLIEAQASAALKRDVQFGDLEVSVWGGFGVRVDGLQIAEDPAYGSEPFLNLEKGIVRVSVWPALFGRIEITTVVLEAPRVRVVRDRRGLSTDSLAASDVEEATVEAVDGDEEEGFDLVVGSLVIEQGRLVFVDRTGASPAEIEIERFDLEVTDLEADSPLTFDLTATWLGASASNLRAGGKLGPLLGEGTAPIVFDVSFELDPLPVGPLLRLEQVAASLPADTRVSGELGVKGSLRGTADAFDFDTRFDATKLAVTMVDTFVKPASSSFLLYAKGHATPKEVRVDTLAFGPAKAQIEGEARVGMDDASPFDAKLRGSSLPLEAWTPLLPAFEGMEMSGDFGLDLRAKGKASDEGLPLLDGRFSLVDASITMPDTPTIEKLRLDTQLAGHTAKGEGGSLELGGSPIRFEFETRDVNASRLSFAFDALELPLAAVGVVEPGSEADDVLKALRVVGEADYGGETLAGHARFASPQGRLKGVGYQNLEGRVEASGTRMVLHELEAMTLGGTLRMQGSLDSADPAQPGFAGTLKLSGVQVSDVVGSQLPQITAVASGRLDTSITLSGRGLETDAILNSLTGTGSFEVFDGRLAGVNIAEEVLGGATGIGALTGWLSSDVKRKHPNLFAKQDTVFETAALELAVQEGRIRADQWTIETDDFALNGAGTIGLDGSLDLDADFRTSVALATTLVGVASPTRFLLSGDKRIVIPVHVTGDLGAPKFRPDQHFLRSTLTRATLGTATGIVSDLLGIGSKDAKGSKPSKTGPAASSESGTTGAAGSGAGTDAETDPDDGAPSGEHGQPMSSDTPAASGSQPQTEPEAKPKPKPKPKPKSVEGLLEQGIQELLKP